MLKKLKFLNLKVQSRTKKMSYIKTVACAEGGHPRELQIYVKSSRHVLHAGLSCFVCGFRLAMFPDC